MTLKKKKIPKGQKDKLKKETNKIAVLKKKSHIIKERKLETVDRNARKLTNLTKEERSKINSINS